MRRVLSLVLVGLLVFAAAAYAWDPGDRVMTPDGEGTVRGTAVIVEVDGVVHVYDAGKVHAVPTATAEPTATPTATPTACDRSATPGTFDAQVAAAAAPETICLATGDYGTFTGTNKAITIKAAAGARPAMDLNLATGDNGFALDGLYHGTSRFLGNPGPRNITIRNCDVTGTAPGGLFEFDGPIDSNILIDNCEFHDIGGITEAAIRWSYSGRTGVTVRNSLFRDMAADGLKIGAAVTVEANEFARVRPDVPTQHTDAIQLFEGRGSVIRGNYIHDGEQCLAAFDGTGTLTIEDNVIARCSAHRFVLGGDTPGSLVRHNTVVGDINCVGKQGFAASRTFIRDNIATTGILLSAGSSYVNCQPSQNTNNLLGSGASGLNLPGLPVFVGGSSPTSYEGFRLAPGSPGKGAASDGLDVGARFD